MSKPEVHVERDTVRVVVGAPLSGEAKKRADLKGRNQSVTRPIPRISGDVLPTKRGRDRKMTPRKMLNGINKYFEHCETTDDMPSIKGMMIHLKMYREDFYRYVKDGRYADMLEHAKLIISHWAERAVWESKGMAAGKIAYMKNVHDWSEKIDTHNISEVRQITVEEATSKIKMLAPLLLEVLKSQNTVNQIARPDGDGVIVEADYEESAVTANQNQA